MLTDGTEGDLVSSILTSPSPGDHDGYWPTLYRLVLKGRLSEARDLLSHHPITHLEPQVHRGRSVPLILVNCFSMFPDGICVLVVDLQKEITVASAMLMNN